MKLLVSLLFIGSAVLVSFFVTVPQFTCTKDTCSYNGIKTLKENTVAYISAVQNAQDLESRRTELGNKYNAVTPEDRQRLEDLLPNNVDNIKLVLELETLAKKHGLLIENPKLQNEVESGAPAVDHTAMPGQEIRALDSSALPYGAFTLDFTVKSSYENMKLLVGDIEKNLRLIEPVSITMNVPNQIPGSKDNLPPGVYDVTIRAVIYYLKN